MQIHDPSFLAELKTKSFHFDIKIFDSTNLKVDKADYIDAVRKSDFSNLPPAMIFPCNYDPLRDEGKAYGEKLQKAGEATVYKNYENIHGFFGIGSIGKQAMQEASTFLKDKLNSYVR